MFGGVSVPSGDLSTLASLLNLIGDPEGAKARLKQIQDAHVGLDAKAQELAAAADALARDKADHAQAAADLAQKIHAVESDKQNLNAVAANIENQRVAVIRDHQAYLDRQSKLDAKDSELAQRDRALAARESALQAAQDALAAKEKEVSKAIAEAQSSRSLYEAKLAALKQAVA